MGTVIAVDANVHPETSTEVTCRPPRRATDPRDLAPVALDDEADDAVGSRVGIVIPGRPEEAAVMRRRIRALVPWRPSEVEKFVSLASELFNNAVRHTLSGDPDGEVTIAIIKRGQRIQVKVIDQGSRDGIGTTPHVRPASPQTEGGFGLYLVAAEASRWGTVYDSDGRTTTWFEIDRLVVMR